MGIRTKALALSAIACLHAVEATAQGGAMTLADVLARAREQAPQIARARHAVEEARARLAGASVRFQSNPELDAWAGNRRGSTGRSTDFEFGLTQGFEPPSRRTARVDGAHAGIAERSASLDDVIRAVLRETAFAYYRVVHADERIRLLDAAYEVASSVLLAADRRYRAGDIAVLDVNIARSSLARVRAERESAEAARAVVLGELKQLLRLQDDISVDGSLVPAASLDLEAALQAAAARPDIRALEAGLQEAEADERLGASFSKPGLGVGVRYSREEGDQIVLGGLTLTLPMFSRGQELRAVGSARATRLRTELEAARLDVQIEVRAAFAAYTHRLAAIRALETEAIPGLNENETLTTRSYEVGQLGLPELLLIRRETLETRFQYLDALLDAAVARTELDASAGVLR